MTTGFAHLGEAMQEVIERAQAMSKQSKKLSEQDDHLIVECEDCQDTKVIIHKVKDKYGDKTIMKDVARPCHCVERRSLQKRFKNALIPSEFENARLTSYEITDDTTRELFEGAKEYLNAFQDIMETGAEHNSLGFIAKLGESRIRAMQGEARYTAKEKHNNFGLGKTHLQIAISKWILNNIKVRDEIAPGQKSKFERGCRVLCISDIAFMEDLTSARMAGDGGVELNRIINDVTRVDVLVWDDLGKVKWSESKEGFYYRIINERYNNKRPIIFSSNEDEGTLSEKIGYAAASRLIGMCGSRLYAVEGTDYRLKE